MQGGGMNILYTVLKSVGLMFSLWRLTYGKARLIQGIPKGKWSVIALLAILALVSWTTSRIGDLDLYQMITF